MNLGLSARQTSLFLLVLPAIAFIFVFFVLPVGSLIRTSFLSDEGGYYTFSVYADILSDSYGPWLLWRTFWISGVTTVICLCLSLPVAFYIRRLHSRWRSVIVFLLLSPLLTSVVVRTLGWISLLGSQGVLNDTLRRLGLAPMTLLYTDASVIIGLTHVFIGYMVLALMTSVSRIDDNLILAANNLGASDLVAAIKVMIPLCIPGAIAGSMLVFSMSASAYATPLLLGGARARVAATEIYDLAIQYLLWREAAAYACLLFVLISIVVGLSTAAAESATRRISGS